MVIHDSFPDFLLFVYVHMSEADHNYDPKEMALIKKKMHALFPEGTDLEKKLYRAIRDYNNFDKSRLDALFMVPSAAIRQVATKTASRGMPASPRMAGLTKTM